MQEEFYSRPIFYVHNVTASIAYYCEKLGFTEMWSSPDNNPIIGQVGRNGTEIILDSQSLIPKASIPSVLSLALHNEEQLGAVYDAFTNKGANITASPFEVAWERNLYQFDVNDLDGNVLIFWGAKPDDNTF